MADAPSPELIATYQHLDPYRDFLKEEGIPVIDAYCVDCVTLPVEPWERTGGLGAYVHLTGRSDYLSCYVAEIPPGGHLEPEQHVFEKNIYVVKGRGATTIELPNGRKHTFEWGEGSAFGIPLNARHQHFNGSGTESARFAAVTNLPVMINMLHNREFLFANSFEFADRYGEERYYAGEGEFKPVRPGSHQWETIFVPDMRSFELPQWLERGAGGNNINFIFAESCLHGHISEFPTGTYKKAHRHDAGAHIFIVTGRGYSLLWLDGEDPVATKKVDWWPGCLFAPPDGPTYHQHFNVSNVPARYLVYLFGSRRYPVFERRKGTADGADKSIKDGGIQVEYEDEDPRILDLFEKECLAAGAQSAMRGYLKRD